jgi:hypothetical protein
VESPADKAQYSELDQSSMARATDFPMTTNQIQTS